jgi:hypothetical protein
LAAENQEVNNQIYSKFGWFFLAKEVADFCNTDFYDIMYRPAVDVAGMTAIIAYKTIYTQNTNNGRTV